MLVFVVFGFLAALTLLIAVMPIHFKTVSRENALLYIMSCVLLFVGYFGTLTYTRHFGWNMFPQSGSEVFTDIFFALVWVSGYGIINRVFVLPKS